MEQFKNLLFFALITISLLIFANSPAIAFSTSDLTGTWRGNALKTGNNSGWGISTTIVNSSGIAVTNYLDSNGDTFVITEQIYINNSGIITIAERPKAHGVMSLDKNCMILTDTWEYAGNSEYVIHVYVKDGGSFSSSDLAGTWQGHMLYTGMWNGWDVTTATINDSGYGTFNWFDSVGDTGEHTGQLYINSSGIITAQGHPYVHGVMSPDKSFFIFTNTSETTGDGEYTLEIFIKSDTNFSTSDLEGTWSSHSLFSGDFNGWQYTQATINNSGQCTDIWHDFDGSQGTSTIQFFINTNGIITAQGKPNAHGVMSQDKNIFVATDTWSDSGENAYALKIYIKQGQPLTNNATIIPVINHLLLNNPN